MDAASLGTLVFNNLPPWLKGTVTFTRTTNTYNPVTGAMTPIVTTASGRCVSQPAKGTQSESFLNMTAIREKYIVMTVPAADLSGFVPQSGDVASLGGATFTVTGVETTQPDGSSTVVYRCTAER